MILWKNFQFCHRDYVCYINIVKEKSKIYYQKYVPHWRPLNSVSENIGK